MEVKQFTLLEMGTGGSEEYYYQSWHVLGANMRNQGFI